MVVTASYKVNENRNSNKNKKMLQSNSTSPKHKGLKELGRQSLLCRCDRVTRNDLRSISLGVQFQTDRVLGGGEGGRSTGRRDWGEQRGKNRGREGKKTEME